MFWLSAIIQNRWIESIENYQNRNQFIYSGKGDNESKSFHILNCESLESIQIGTIGNVTHNSVIVRL